MKDKDQKDDENARQESGGVMGDAETAKRVLAKFKARTVMMVDGPEVTEQSLSAAYDVALIHKSNTEALSGYRRGVINAGNKTGARGAVFKKDLRGYLLDRRKQNPDAKLMDIARDVCNVNPDSPAVRWKHHDDAIPAKKFWNVKNKKGEHRKVDSVVRLLRKLEMDLQQ